MVVSLDLWMVAGAVGGEKTLQDLPHVLSLIALPDCLTSVLQVGGLVWSPVQNSWLTLAYWVSVTNNGRTLPICGTMGFLTIRLYSRNFCMQWLIRTGYLFTSQAFLLYFLPLGF